LIRWHADIKPDNILSVHGKFKLADPGFAHFIKKTDAIPMGEILGGTETFGAPECHPSRRRSSTAVHQTIDIWSLACVFSIAATWVALGYQGILQYAEFRKNAIKDYKKQNPSQLGIDASDENASEEKRSMEDYFHNSHEVLPEVTSWHKSLRIILRKSDTLTSRVLDLIDNKMLLSDPLKRLSAEETCIELGKIYKEAEEAQDELESKVPEEITEGLRRLDDSAPARALPKTPSEESSPDLHSRNAKSKRLEVPLMKTTHRSEVFKPEPHRISQQVLADIDESEAPTGANRVQLSGMAQVSGEQGTGSTSPQYAASAYAQSDLTQPTAMPYSTTTTAGLSSYDATPRRPPALPHMSSSNSSNSSKSRTPRQDVVEARRQLDQGTKGLRGMGRRIFKRHKKDTVLSSHFNNRDLLFLVDNGATMKQFWGQATLLLETLVMKASGQDPDGPDLKFTMGQVELKGEKNASVFKEAMGHHQAMPTDEVTNIRTSFGNIFDQYLKDLERAKRTHEKVKQLTVIVLTDGIWPGTLVKQEVDEQIKTFVRGVWELTNNLIPRYVSIEFIQFGKDPEATIHLRDLDDLLTSPGFPSANSPFLLRAIDTNRKFRDVIDTEPADGDVYKMLLGSFVDSYDEDENRLELVESPHGTQESASLYTSYSNHTSPSHDGPYAAPTRTATEMSQQTIRPSGPSQAPAWPLSEPSRGNHYPGYP
jgi:Protein kinase domain